jgi:hypothetical protein
MAKLLAALNLPQVGEIKMLPADHPDDGEREIKRIESNLTCWCGRLEISNVYVNLFQMPSLI